MEQAPRSIRNNNPLNIRRNGDLWQGLKPQQTDPQFCQFESMAMGWRAAFILLTRTYYFKYHLTTLRRIITRWAPPAENRTDAYVRRVVELTGINSDRPLDPPSRAPTDWMKLASAMAIVEAGNTARGLDYFGMMDGWKMAYELTLKGSFKHE